MLEAFSPSGHRAIANPRARKSQRDPADARDCRAAGPPVMTASLNDPEGDPFSDLDWDIDERAEVRKITSKIPDFGTPAGAGR